MTTAPKADTIIYSPPATIREFIKDHRSGSLFYDWIVGPVGSGKTTGLFFKLVHMANVSVTHTNSVEVALEYAYKSTQNIHGSWSRGEFFEDGARNLDYNSDVEVLVDLEEYEGRLYGHRSSMMGDIFILNDQEVYEVDFCGFERKENAA